MSAADHPTRRSQSENSARYDRVARWYKLFEPAYLIFPPARRRAVVALKLKPGDAVLEVGAGTGRNFRYLIDIVGPTGTVIGIDASAGMLGEAEKLVRREGWSNVQLLRQDAAEMKIGAEVDAVLFSLSYSAMPQPRPALAAAWSRLRPGGRLVVMDLGLTDGGWVRLLDPIARLLLRFTPGDPYSDPWSDLAQYGRVSTKRFLLQLFYVSAITKR